MVSFHICLTKTDFLASHGIGMRRCSRTIDTGALEDLACLTRRS